MEFRAEAAMHCQTSHLELCRAALVTALYTPPRRFLKDEYSPADNRNHLSDKSNAEVAEAATPILAESWVMGGVGEGEPGERNGRCQGDSAERQGCIQEEKRFDRTQDGALHADCDQEEESNHTNH